MAQIQIVYTTSNRLDELSIKDGQVIFVMDTRSLYMDMKGKRTNYSTIFVFGTDEERLAVETPAQGFYYVEETKIV